MVQESSSKKRNVREFTRIGRNDTARETQEAETLLQELETEKQKFADLSRTFDATLTALKDFVYTFDTSGRFTYANRALLELVGLTLDEVIGKNFHERA